jgi:hypothetical protein
MRPAALEKRKHRRRRVEAELSNCFSLYLQIVLRDGRMGFLH